MKKQLGLILILVMVIMIGRTFTEVAAEEKDSIEPITSPCETQKFVQEFSISKGWGLNKDKVKKSCEKELDADLVDYTIKCLNFCTGGNFLCEASMEGTPSECNVESRERTITYNRPPGTHSIGGYNDEQHYTKKITEYLATVLTTGTCQCTTPPDPA